VQPWTLPAEVVATLLLIILSAKAHGRQIRLERERHGVWSVNFRTENDAWVEALWRKDRQWFWSLYGGFLAAKVGAVMYWIGPSGAALVGWVVVAAGWALCGSFIVMGLASSLRLMRDMKKGVPSEEWRRAGHRGSLLWWSLTGLAAAAVALVLAV